MTAGLRTRVGIEDKMSITDYIQQLQLQHNMPTNHNNRGPGQRYSRPESNNSQDNTDADPTEEVTDQEALDYENNFDSVMTKLIEETPSHSALGANEQRQQMTGTTTTLKTNPEE